MLEQALDAYGLGGADARLLRHNENMTYRVERDGRRRLLRIHRPADGFDLGVLRSATPAPAMIGDEMRLLALLAKTPASRTQRPVRNRDGEMVTLLDGGVPATLLEWVEGATLDAAPLTEATAFAMGTASGGLQPRLASLRLEHRYRYGEAMLGRMADVCAQAAARGLFEPEDARVLEETLRYIRSFFERSPRPRTLVHADLSLSNLLDCGGVIVPIDFSLSGYCLPEMDVASLCGHFGDPALRRAVVRGWLEASGLALDGAAVDVCFCFQILLFVACQHERYAHEAWFAARMAAWREEYFRPLCAGGRLFPDLPAL